jgi:HAE1 family hydrophobic/amphiphilic exporter-1
MRISELCIRPVMTILMMCLVLFGSSFGRHHASGAEVPTVTVTVEYPGASADTMAASIVAPLERQFSTISGVASITSVTTAGITRITLEFDQKRAIDAALSDLQSAVSAVSAGLPQDLPTPAIATSGGDR